MNKKELLNIGVPQTLCNEAIACIKRGAKEGYFMGKTTKVVVRKVLENPETFQDDNVFSPFANKLIALKEEEAREAPVHEPCPSRVWGEMDENTKKQFEFACSLPIVVQAASMSDNHLGYGANIGAVLATKNAIIPYAIGVDISCMMRLSVLDLPAKDLKDVHSKKGDDIARSISQGTKFGMGSFWRPRLEHPVMDKDWNVTPVTKELKDKAWNQLGTSGSGNHFVEIGTLTLAEPALGLKPGTYMALMSHSGSRGAGATVCAKYNAIAKSKLPRYYKHFEELAWLDLDTQEGQEYWLAMNLMADYASANHDCIHKNVAAQLHTEIITSVGNSHNLCWVEIHNGEKLYVHRKGATPASEGVLGVIPGSMADPAFVVRGKGNAESLRSASHGAGRRMSRRAAIKAFNWQHWKSVLKERGVRLISAGLDEVPGSYKDIMTVMSQQTDLVEIIAQFDPKIVKMSDDGRAED